MLSTPELPLHSHVRSHACVVPPQRRWLDAAGAVPYFEPYALDRPWPNVNRTPRGIGPGGAAGTPHSPLLVMREPGASSMSLDYAAVTPEGAEATDYAMFTP